MTQREVPGVDQRETERSYIHRLDSEYAWILSRSGELRARVLDLTPKGIGLVLEGASARVPLLMQKGDLVMLRVERGGQPVTVKARLATRNETLLEKDTLRLGFRIESDDEALLSKMAQADIRQEEARPRRFSLRNAPILECESDDYLRLGQKAFYKIRDVSLKGALLETSARNKFLLPNLKMPLSITIPGHGNFSENVLVRRVQTAGDRYWVGIEFLSLEPATIEALGNFCMNFAEDVSYQIMLEEGFPVKVLEEGLTAQAMTSRQDFMQILQIRLQAAHQKGLRLQDIDPWAFMDAEDDEARQVSVKIGKRVVASARLLETTEDILNLGSVVIDKGFSRAVKGQKIETFLWREILRAALASGRQRLELSEPEAIPEFVKSLGARAVEDRWEISLRALAEGRRARFSVWALTMAPAIRELVRDKKLTITRITEGKLHVARWLEKVWPKHS